MGNNMDLGNNKVLKFYVNELEEYIKEILNR